jgi:hypothetical protein
MLALKIEKLKKAQSSKDALKSVESMELHKQFLCGYIFYR